jgi:predicted phage terminase large subunit-like protein
MVKRDWFREVVPAAPAGCVFVRYWDKAGTEGGGAYTAGVLLAKDRHNYVYVADVVRGQWGAPAREAVIRTTAEADRARYGTVRVVVEQEPGSGGKESAEATIRNLSGFAVEADRPTGDKSLRLEPFAAQAAAGNVRLVAGPWVGDYLAELTAFPSGKYRDQADATSGAFNRLALLSAGASIGLPPPGSSVLDRLPRRA